ncbi:FtsX-like permease family protein [Phytohabitans sp. ZYX-F-186]|uniref:FtsX-like permease family protein n=1 Tax=Phytohabitans maris TaxID=3071409 RepID=A0ABU0ZED3_9ACTN|nr:FtsX-like permease family protein [Phytohabitans sp. ZYX-F-186]MDQ7905419.1 FtsX-like permease family protein [Phytohabitans sp. ZYX-F-186]
MIRFGLRLALASGQEAVVRLVIIAAAVALGVGLLLTALAGINAVGAQNQRYAWLNSGLVGETPGPEAADPSWWVLRDDYHQARRIGRLDIAATGPDSPVPPGIPRLPGPGEFYVSPALGELLRTSPEAELADRFPGHEIGTIGDSALPSPDSLLIVVGRTPQELSRMPGADRVASIMTTDPSECDRCVIGIGTEGITLVLSVVAGALIVPLLILIGTATRLAAARREQRFAAMRLVGATPRQISVISAVESTVAAVAGTVAGIGLFFALRPALATIPFTGERFFAGDLSLGLLDVLLVVLGVPLGAAVAARLALRRVRISPLGVTRRVTPRPPRAWRLILLAAGVAELCYFVGRRPSTTNGQLIAYMSGFVMIMVGLVVAGPWLTLVGSRLLAGRSRHAAALIAGRRLADSPQAGFRAVSGLTLALFVTSVATGVMSTIVAERGAPRTGSVMSSTLSQSFDTKGSEGPSRSRVPAGLASISGVEAVHPVYASPRDGGGPGSPDWYPGMISCADLARSPEFGSCSPGAEVAYVWHDLIGPRRATDDPPVWPAAPIDTAGVQALPLVSVVVTTDGSVSAVERSRTVLEAAFPDSGRYPATVADFESDFRRSLVQWQQLANVVIVASLAIAGCSLAVSVAGGLTERKRPFSMLRLAGVPLATLRRVVAVESAVPLLLVAVLAIGMGFVAAQLFLTSQLDYTLRPPGPAYYAAVVGGLVASLAIIASTLPLLRRITGPETARNE